MVDSIGASASQTGLSQQAAEPEVSALRASIPSVVTLGFTGSQTGCTPPQLNTLKGWLGTLWMAGFEWMENGDCIGSDAQAAAIWQLLGLKISLRPPVFSSKRAYLKHDRCAEQRPYLDRNKDIVRHSVAMVATPSEFTEQLRSGTWSTIRFARKLRRPLCIIWPDGAWAGENGFTQAIEARRATTGTGVVHESAVAESHAPATSPNTPPTQDTDHVA